MDAIVLVPFIKANT